MGDCLDCAGFRYLRFRLEYYIVGFFLWRQPDSTTLIFANSSTIIATNVCFPLHDLYLYLWHCFQVSFSSYIFVSLSFILDLYQHHHRHDHRLQLPRYAGAKLTKKNILPALRAETRQTTRPVPLPNSPALSAVVFAVGSFPAASDIGRFAKEVSLSERRTKRPTWKLLAQMMLRMFFCTRKRNKNWQQSHAVFYAKNRKPSKGMYAP